MPQGKYELLAVAVTFFIAMYSPLRALDFAMLALIALAVYRFTEARSAGEGVNAERATQKDANLSRLLSVAQRKGDISNHEVQALLGVSDATATRYLEELEQRGKLSQVGKTGSHVHYRPH